MRVRRCMVALATYDVREQTARLSEEAESADDLMPAGAAHLEAPLQRVVLRPPLVDRYVRSECMSPSRAGLCVLAV